MEHWKENNEDIDPSLRKEAPQLVVQQFSMESLHQTMINNGNQILGMYDE